MLSSVCLHGHILVLQSLERGIHVRSRETWIPSGTDACGGASPLETLLKDIVPCFAFCNPIPKDTGVGHLVVNIILDQCCVLGYTRGARHNIILEGGSGRSDGRRHGPWQ